MYLEQGLSAKQIAEKLGVSKTFILEQLHALGIRHSTDRMTNPNNYRANNPPFGWRVKDRKLVPHKAELKICRRVVDLVGRSNSYTAVAKELERLGFKNRKGKVVWDHKTIISIYNRWKDKL